MARFLIRRVVYLLILVAAATAFAFVLASYTLNPSARFDGKNPPVDKHTIQLYLQEHNADPAQPVVVRMGHWAKQIVTKGDFGLSADGDSVQTEIGRRMWVSLRLVLGGSVLGAIFGCAIGAYSAVKQYRIFDQVATIFSYVILSMPAVVLAALIAIWGANLNLALGRTQNGSQIFYTVGEYSTGHGGWGPSDLLNRFQHGFLPSMVLILVGIAFYSRYQRNSMLDVLGQDFLRTAQAKGLTRTQALIKHGLRTALIPLTTFFVFSVALSFTGATFTERIFTWHGMGEYLVNAITKNDINGTAATTLFVAVLVLIAGFLSDVAYAALDPRVRV
jgi:peptide/nickel transport system permease protein